MNRRQYALAAVLFVLGAVLLMAARPSGVDAAAGGATDADDSASTLDIQSVTHNDTGDIDTGKITYTLVGFNDFGPCWYDVVWHLYLPDGDASEDGSVLVRSDSSPENNDFDIARVQGPGGTVQDATASYNQATRTLTVEYNRSALQDLGLQTGTFYDYFVTTDTGSNNSCAAGTDQVPNTAGSGARIRHDLGQAGATTTTLASGTTTSTAGGGATTTTSAGGATTTTSAGGATTTTVTGGATTTTVTGGATTTTVAGATTTTLAGAATTTTTTCGTARVTVSPSSVTAGSAVRVDGACFAANTDHTVTMNSQPVTLGTARSDGAGNFSASFTIPRSTSSGTHTITVSGASRTASAQIVVTGGTLAVTGDGNSGVMWIGIALLFGGLVLVAGKILGDQNEDWANSL